MLLRWSTGNKCFQNLGISSIDDSELQRNQTEIVRPSLGCGVHRVDLLDEPSVGVPHYNMNLVSKVGADRKRQPQCAPLYDRHDQYRAREDDHIFPAGDSNQSLTHTGTDGQKNGARTPASFCAETRDRTRETQPRSKGKHATQHLNS